MEPLQWVGLLILLLLFAALILGRIFELWPQGSAPWWQKLVKGYGVYAVLGAIVVLAIVIPNTKRRKGLLAVLLLALLGWLIFLLAQYLPLLGGI